jgi:hypothetical protein
MNRDVRMLLKCETTEDRDDALARFKQDAKAAGFEISVTPRGTKEIVVTGPESALHELLQVEPN